MKTLCLHSVRQLETTDQPSANLLLIEGESCRETPQVLWLSEEGELHVSARNKLKHPQRSIASLLCRSIGNQEWTWLLAPLSSALMHNGIRPLPLAILEAGDVLAFEEQSWLASELWRPAPAPAPEKIADKECSVCGAALHLAPVILCPCGRYYHLERPDNPDDPQALNCYLTAGTCGLCERKPSLAPQFLPWPPEELISAERLETALAGV